MATRKTGNFAYDHPALVATIACFLIGGAFLFALKQSASGHHGSANHGPATHGSAAHGSAAPSASAAPAKK